MLPQKNKSCGPLTNPKPRIQHPRTTKSTTKSYKHTPKMTENAEKEAKDSSRSRNLDGKQLHTETQIKLPVPKNGPADKISKTPQAFCSDQPYLPPPPIPDKTPRLQSSAPKMNTSDEPQPPPKSSTFSKFWRETPPSQSEPHSETPWPADILIGGRQNLEKTMD